MAVCTTRSEAEQLDPSREGGIRTGAVASDAIGFPMFPIQGKTRIAVVVENQMFSVPTIHRVAPQAFLRS